MRRFVVPDEDAWHMPKDWSGRVHPRRGGRWRPAIADPAGTAQRLRDLLATDKAAKQRASVLGRNAVFDTALLAAGERHLRTLDADPTAAAVAALLLVYRNVPADGQGLVDGWVARAGLLFAVRAVVAANQICHTGELWTRAARAPRTRSNQTGHSRTPPGPCLSPFGRTNENGEYSYLATFPALV
ncbi:hypothetical protein AB0B74_07990 [Micromonospora parva]|uniref:hypothetical protein n=1 Tax=Micromonospora parva TaxID=1464048 RepID=UPI0034009C7F